MRHVQVMNALLTYSNHYAELDSEVEVVRYTRILERDRMKVTKLESLDLQLGEFAVTALEGDKVILSGGVTRETCGKFRYSAAVFQ